MMGVIGQAIARRPFLLAIRAQFSLPEAVRVRSRMVEMMGAKPSSSRTLW
jgi:hypothetical protein